MSYDNTNTGVLFTNQRKESPKHPDWQGSINIEGREYWLSAWNNRHAAKGDYFRLTVKPKDAAPPIRHEPRDPVPMSRIVPGVERAINASMGRDDNVPPQGTYSRDLLGKKIDDDVPF